MGKSILKITGMHCASCASSIEVSLKETKGIKSANINIATEKALIEYDSNIIDLGKVFEIIKSLGYSAVEDFGEENNSENKYLKLLKIKLGLSFVFALPLMYLAMAPMFGIYVPEFLTEKNNYIQFILATLVIVINFGIWSSGLKNIVRLRPNMDSLIFLGTFSAYVYSLLGMFIGMEESYFESAVFIILFISLGKFLETITKGKATAAVKKLAGLQSKDAIIEKNGEEISIRIENVKIGDIVIVKPGWKIPVDGIIMEGFAAIDEKAITGESIPVDKKVGDEIIGGTINKTGYIKFRATKIGKDTMLANIIKIVEEAINSKAPIQLLADTVSYYFVPAILAIAFIAAGVWLLFGYSFSFALAIFIAVLIIACPCALGLATPTAVIIGTGLAAERGILIKSGKALEIARKINYVVFDKTGTLTKGEPEVTDILEIDNAKFNKKEILKIAASAENYSEHPLAQAIVNEAKKEKISLIKVSNFEVLPGEGVKCEIDKKKIFVGKISSLKNSKEIEGVSVLENKGKTVIAIKVDSDVVGLIAISDTLREHSKDAVNSLHKNGVKVAMLTGDNKRVGDAIAEKLGIDRVLSEVMPSEKAKTVREIQDEGNVVAMVGDGINDAPALAQSDLGIAIGSGTDIAMETGDIVLIKNDVRDVAKAIKISSYTFRKIKQNLFWAFVYNIVGVPVAAGVLYPLTGILLNPMIAAAAMAFSSVSVVLNSLLMKTYK
ncbi:cadmium-translocating P-type ATPase [Candidatus Gracilibacteria bacterium]|nr:cadmium-translocating P-type ATPase [Candidatus Gracilibacteria bacterium]